MEQVRRAGQIEGLDVRKPREQKLPSLRERRSGELPEDRESGLRDPSRILPRERPLLQRRKLLAEERVSVFDGLLEGTGERLIQRAAVVRSEDALEEGVERTGFVAAAISPNRRLNEIADEVRLQLRDWAQTRRGAR